MVFNSTLYEGALERACVELGVPVFGIALELPAVKLSSKTVRNQLLEQWKKRQGKAEYGGVKFVEQPPTTASDDAEAVPTMQLCKIIGEDSSQVLTVPTDVRQKWLADPVHAPEWRGLLRKFDAKHGASPVPQLSSPGSVSASVPAGEGQDATPDADASWSNIFKDDPKSVVDLQKKFNQMAGTFAIACGDGIVCHVVEGPQFFLAAPTNAGSVLADQAVLGHGGGVWLLDAKASKAIQD